MASSVERAQPGSSTHRGQGSRPAQKNPISSKAFNLSGAQILVLWSFMAGLLVMCFLFGFYAGREQGLRVAFEQYSGQAARIPIAAPVASENSLIQRSEDVATVQDSNSLISEGAEDESAFDFSEESKLLAAAANKGANRESAAKENIEQAAKPVVKPQEAAKAGSAARSQQNSSAIASGWYIQIAASKTEENAKEIAGKLKGSDYKTAFEVAEVGSQRYFRVLVGPYSSRSEAEKMRQHLAKRKITKAMPFLKRVS